MKRTAILIVGMFFIGLIAGQFMNIDKLEKPALTQAVAEANKGRVIAFSELSDSSLIGGKMHGGYYKVISVIDAETGTAVLEHYTSADYIHHDNGNLSLSIGTNLAQKDSLILVQGIPAELLKEGEFYLRHSSLEG